LKTPSGNKSGFYGSVTLSYGYKLQIHSPPPPQKKNQARIFIKGIVPRDE